MTLLVDTVQWRRFAGVGSDLYLYNLLDTGTLVLISYLFIYVKVFWDINRQYERRQHSCLGEPQNYRGGTTVCVWLSFQVIVGPAN